MKDLAVLTPPLLTCAAVLLAVGAFLRHEMGKKRPAEDEQSSDGIDKPPTSAPATEMPDSGVSKSVGARDER